jgi:hypothetical protein
MASGLAACIKLPIAAKLKRNEIRTYNQLTGTLDVQKLDALFNSDFFSGFPELRANDQGTCGGEGSLL